METRNVKRKTNDRCAPLPKKWGRWICRCVCCQFFFWAVEDQRCGEALELGGHGHRNPPRCHADTRSDLDHDSGIPLQISTEIRTMYPNHVKRWGPHPERCPRLSRQAGQQGILTEPQMALLIFPNSDGFCTHQLIFCTEIFPFPWIWFCLVILYEIPPWDSSPWRTREYVLQLFSKHQTSKSKLPGFFVYLKNPFYFAETNRTEFASLKKNGWLFGCFFAGGKFCENFWKSTKRANWKYASVVFL